jgi:hypothetical protein
MRRRAITFVPGRDARMIAERRSVPLARHEPAVVAA